MIAYVFYASAVLHSARPTLSAWISWGLMDGAILAAMICAGEIAWQMVAYVIGVVVVLAVSIYKKAILDWKRLDTYCMAIVVIAVALWAISGNPNIAIILSLVAITVGCIPLIANVWKDPSREPLLPWLLITIGGIFGVLAIREWNIAAALTPVWFFALMSLFVLLLMRKPNSRATV